MCALLSSVAQSGALTLHFCVGLFLVSVVRVRL